MGATFIVVAVIILAVAVVCGACFVVFGLNKRKSNSFEELPAKTPELFEASTGDSPSFWDLPQADDGITGETIAAISAAISMMIEQPFTITGVSKRGAPGPANNRPVWALAGMRHNVKPF